jgi:hypothetical protein
MKSSLIKTSSRRADPSHLPVAWCLILLLRHLGLVISFILRLDVINTGYIIYSLFIVLYVKLDSVTHKGNVFSFVLKTRCDTMAL